MTLVEAIRIVISHADRHGTNSTYWLEPSDTQNPSEWEQVSNVVWKEIPATHFSIEVNQQKVIWKRSASGCFGAVADTYPIAETPLWLTTE